jgi:hypothetical protein
LFPSLVKCSRRHRLPERHPKPKTRGTLKKALAALPESRFKIVSRKGQGGYKRNNISPATGLELLKYHVKPIPCHREDVPGKKKAQPDNTPKDDSMSRYSHTSGHHTTVASTVVLAPSDIFCCLPFSRALHAQGVSFANSFPTREIFEKGLHRLLGENGQEYDEWLVQAEAFEAKLVKEEAAARAPEDAATSKPDQQEGRKRERENRRSDISLGIRSCSTIRTAPHPRYGQAYRYRQGG